MKTNDEIIKINLTNNRLSHFDDENLKEKARKMGRLEIRTNAKCRLGLVDGAATLFVYPHRSHDRKLGAIAGAAVASPETACLAVRDHLYADRSAHQAASPGDPAVEPWRSESRPRLYGCFPPHLGTATGNQRGFLLIFPRFGPDLKSPEIATRWLRGVA